MIYGVPSCHFHFPWIGFLAAILKWDINQRNYWFPLLSYAKHPQRVQFFSKVEFILQTWISAPCIFCIPFFTAVYIVQQLLVKSIYILNKEILQKKSTVYNQELGCLVHVHLVRNCHSYYLFCDIGNKRTRLKTWISSWIVRLLDWPPMTALAFSPNGTIWWPPRGFGKGGPK